MSISSARVQNLHTKVIDEEIAAETAPSNATEFNDCAHQLSRQSYHSSHNNKHNNNVRVYRYRP